VYHWGKWNLALNIHVHTNKYVPFSKLKYKVLRLTTFYIYDPKLSTLCHQVWLGSMCKLSAICFADWIWKPRFISYLYLILYFISFPGVNTIEIMIGHILAQFFVMVVQVCLLLTVALAIFKVCISTRFYNIQSNLSLYIRFNCPESFVNF